MPDIRFNCPECEEKLVVDAAGVGRVVPCPQCNRLITIPSPADADAGEAPIQPPGNTCTRCGKTLLLDQHQLVSACEEAGIALQWGSLGPTLTRGNASAAGINDIYNLLAQLPSPRNEF